jgi:DNA-binding NarL/FixJ family response regulator
MTVLIVEDNAGVRRLLGNAIAEVMDVRMPGMDGLAATKQILRLYPSARVIMVTDYDDEALRNAAQQAGACAYVLKQNLLDLARLLGSVVE